MTLLMRRDIVQQCGGWNEALGAGRDRDFFISIAMSHIVTMAERQRPEKSKVGALMCDASGRGSYWDGSPRFRSTRGFARRPIMSQSTWSNISIGTT
jgi:hypothetical protein